MLFFLSNHHPFWKFVIFGRKVGEKTIIPLVFFLKIYFLPSLVGLWLVAVQVSREIEFLVFICLQKSNIKRSVKSRVYLPHNLASNKLSREWEVQQLKILHSFAIDPFEFAIAFWAYESPIHSTGKSKSCWIFGFAYSVVELGNWGFGFLGLDWSCVGK